VAGGPQGQVHPAWLTRFQGASAVSDVTLMTRSTATRCVVELGE
jgi:hypothetical protein